MDWAHLITHSGARGLRVGLIVQANGTGYLTVYDLTAARKAQKAEFVP